MGTGGYQITDHKLHCSFNENPELQTSRQRPISFRLVVSPREPHRNN